MGMYIFLRVLEVFGKKYLSTQIWNSLSIIVVFNLTAAEPVTGKN